MIAVKLSYIAKTLGWRHIGPDIEIKQVVTDSRKVTAGDCFIALYGDNFDAHQFIKQVIDDGANALIVSQEQQTSVPQLVVADTRLALGQLAGLVAQLSNTKKVAITGSCGKTTVKEMLAAILSTRFNVLSTAGNFNNDIGVPLTLLRLTEQHDVAVIEVGANHIGEIDYTSGLVKPDVSIITNIGAAHLEGFGGIEGVVKAKSEIFNHLAEHGEAIFDANSPYSKQWQLVNQQRKMSRFCATDCGQNSEIYASDITSDAQGCASFTMHSALGSISLTLALPGQHNVANALAASAAAIALGVELTDIAKGLLAMGEVSGRLNVSEITPSLKVIDDTYNANSSSITAAVELLAQYDAKTLLVLGDMGELGEYAVATHQALGSVIEQNNIDVLMSYGQLSQHYGHDYHGVHLHFTDKAQLNQAIEKQLIAFGTQPVVVLAKGSRSTRMESVVEFIKNNNNIKGAQQC